MKNLLVICPSRGRPLMCLTMAQSFRRTATSGTDLLICIDEDDPQLEKYKELLKNFKLVIGPRATTTEIINRNIDLEYNYLSVTNDDFFYKTEEWDHKLIMSIIFGGNPGIAYGNDLCAGVHIPTTSVISREIIATLGWLQLPGLKHLFGDNVWCQIGRGAKCLHYNQEVFIEHRHVFARKMQEDETFKFTNSKEMYEHDEKVFLDWLSNQSKIDVEKVKSLNA